MKARLALLLALALPGRAGDALELEASREEGGVLRVRVRHEALPPRAHVAVSLERMLGSQAIPLERFRVVIGSGGEGAAEIRIGKPLLEPGVYRVRASLHEQGQHPEVLKALPGSKPSPSEVRLEEDLSRRPYLQGLIEEQAHLSSSMTWTEGFLEQLPLVEAQGVEAWEAWRGASVPELKRILERGRGRQNVFFPRTHSAFTRRFLYDGVFNLESRRFIAARNAGTYHGTGLFSDRTSLDRKEVAPYREMLLLEAGASRLTVLRALARNPRRKDCEEVLALWASDPKAFDDPRWKGLMELAPLFRAWLDAGPEAKEAAKAALESRYAELEAAFKPK